MCKKLFFNTLLVFSFFCFSSCSNANELFANEGFVRASNQRIVKGDGDEIILKGVGLGGWMIQEGYMLGTQGAQHEIRSFLEEMAGVAATNKFYEDWLSFFVNQNDIKQIAQWGYNSIRLPMHYNLYLDGNGHWIENSTGLILTDNLIKWCKEEGLFLILDLHAAPGGQGNNQDISDRRDGESLWTNEASRNATILFWYKLAQYYKNEKTIAGYDLLNEPNYDFEDSGNSKGCNCLMNKPLLDLYQDIIDTIRSVDRNHLLIIEGNCYGSNYNGLESLAQYDPERNLAFSFHNYWSPNTVASTQDMLDLRRKLNVPLWRGEIGENSNTWFTEMVESMESLKIGYANWPWKKINTLDGPVIIEPIQEWNKLMAYRANSSSPKPSVAESQIALSKLIEHVKLENCRLMHDVAYAYLKSPYGMGSKPFAKHTLPGVIYATDYDYGKLNESWYDTDYQNISGNSSNTAWNKGEQYRNDGVDIWATTDSDSNGYYIGKTESGEWLSYSLDKISTGRYSIKFRVRSAKVATGKIQLVLDDQVLLTQVLEIEQPNQWIDIISEDIELNSGTSFKLKFIEGGFDLSSLKFFLDN